MSSISAFSVTLHNHYQTDTQTNTHALRQNLHHLTSHMTTAHTVTTRWSCWSTSLHLNQLLLVIVVSVRLPCTTEKICTTQINSHVCVDSFFYVYVFHTVSLVIAITAITATTTARTTTEQPGSMLMVMPPVAYAVQFARPVSRPWHF